MTIWLATERRSALITGGSRGIGRGIATHLSQQGWTRTLVGCARVQLAQVHSELDIAAAAVHIVAADQTVDAAIELHRRTFGSMNALILAAGVARPDPSRTIPKPRPDKQIALNFRSPFLLAGQAMPLLRAGVAASGTGSARVMIPEHTGRGVELDRDRWVRDARQCGVMAGPWGKGCGSRPQKSGPRRGGGGSHPRSARSSPSGGRRRARRRCRRGSTR